MTQPSRPTLTQCSYTLLDSDIHELVVKRNTSSAADELFSRLNSIFDGKTRQDPTLRILVDASASGIPPLARLMPGARDLVARHPDRPEVQYAFLLPEGSTNLISMLEAFIRLFRPTNKVRSFRSSERASAIAWLRGSNSAGAVGTQ